MTLGLAAGLDTQLLPVRSSSWAPPSETGRAFRCCGVVAASVWLQQPGTLFRRSACLLAARAGLTAGLVAACFAA